MIKRILIVLLLTGASFRAMACDVCGCSLSGLYFGYMSLQDRNLIGLQYNRATFSAYIDNDDYYFEDEYSNDTYQRVDLTGKFSITNKLQIRYIVPYMFNSMNGSHQNVDASGIGDPIVMAYYNVLNTSDKLEGVWHSLDVGGGFELPVGDYDMEDQGELINRNFQLGSGSLDYILSANYIIRRDKWGINTEGSYKLNTTNSHEYRFGNQWNVSASVFRYFETQSVSFLPFAGVYYEFGDYHQLNGIREANTGGESLLGTLGGQLYLSRLTFNTQYQFIIDQSFNTDEFATIEGGNRFTFGVFYSF